MAKSTAESGDLKEGTQVTALVSPLDVPFYPVMWPGTVNLQPPLVFCVLYAMEAGTNCKSISHQPDVGRPTDRSPSRLVVCVYLPRSDHNSCLLYFRVVSLSVCLCICFKIKNSVNLGYF